MSAARLERLAVGYLQRFPASVARFRLAMQRKLDRVRDAQPDDAASFPQWLASAEARCLNLGLLDDEAYGRGVVRTLHRRGLAIRNIRQRLRQKGLDGETIDRAVETLLEDGDGDPDFTAAVTFAQRKRLGPFAPPELRRERYRRHLAAMARRGFSFGLASRVLEGEAGELVSELDSY